MKAEKEMLLIGQLASQSETDAQTIRYYERIALLAKPERSMAGYRLYEQKTVDRLLFVKRAKGVGFTLREIRRLLDIAEGSVRTCDDVREFVTEKLEHVQEQIRHMQDIEKALVQLGKACSRRKTIGDCPVLRQLSGVDKPIGITTKRRRK